MNRKQVSIGKFEKLLAKAEAEITFPVGDSDETVVVTVQRRIGLDDMLQFVSNVASTVAYTDSNGFHFLPEVFEFTFRSNVIQFYSNLRLPENIQRQYELLYGTGVPERILEEIDPVQVQDIRSAIQQKIKFLLDNATDTAQYQLIQITHKIEDLIATATLAADDFDLSQLTAVANSLQGLDEEKLVDAVVKATQHNVEPADQNEQLLVKDEELEK